MPLRTIAVYHCCAPLLCSCWSAWRTFRLWSDKQFCTDVLCSCVLSVLMLMACCIACCMYLQRLSICISVHCERCSSPRTTFARHPVVLTGKPRAKESPCFAKLCSSTRRSLPGGIRATYFDCGSLSSVTFCVHSCDACSKMKTSRYHTVEAFDPKE